METLTIKIKPDQLSALDQVARRSKRERDAVIEEAIGQYLSLQSRREEKIDEGLRQADAGEFASDEEVEAIFAKWRSA